MLGTPITRRTALAGLLAATHTGRALQSVAPRKVYEATTFGAIPDGSASSTHAIQTAIDTCSREGGGEVHLAPGRYVCGTLLLKDQVTLHLDREATILGSLDPADYRLVDAFTDGVNQTRGYTLIGAIDAHDVGIRGEGTIDGRGPELQHAAGKVDAAKPFLVRWVRTRGVHMSGVHLQNSAAWTMHLFQSDDAVFEGLSIHGLGLPNNDGIDVDSSQHVRIHACTFDTGDDAICLKTTSPRPTTDIAITNCTISTRCAAFKLGTESAGDFARITVQHCHVLKANLGAIKILSVDGANIRDILVEDLTVDNVDTPIFLRLGARLKTFRPGDTPRPTGSIDTITIRRIHVASARRIAVMLSGLPGHPIRNVTIDGLDVTMDQPPTTPAATDTPQACRPTTEVQQQTIADPDPAEKPTAYPEIRMFGETLPAFALYARHVAGLTIANASIHETPTPRPAIALTDVSDCHLTRWSLPTAGPHGDVSILRNVQSATLTEFDLAGIWTSLIHLDDAPANEPTLTPSKDIAYRGPTPCAATNVLTLGPNSKPTSYRH